MRLCSLAFLAGIYSLQFLHPLPPLSLGCQLAVTVCLIAIGFNNLGLVASLKPLPSCLIFSLLFIIGWCWMLLHVQWQQRHRLPNTLAGKRLILRGEISAVPERADRYQQFEFHAQQLQATNTFIPINYRLRLAWYAKSLPILQVGSYWQLVVRLKQPHSTFNPGCFDYERWLFAHRIDGLGYVVNQPTNQCLATANHYSKLIERARQYLEQAINHSLAGRQNHGLIAALVVGIRNNITVKQWQTMQATGTNHLMAIAGLHIGFVASFIFVITSWLWRRSSYLPLYFPTPQVAAIAALLAALCYSCLAGFALPTQRALIMLAVFLTATLLRRNVPPWHAWSMALFLVLLIDPLTVLTDSFWLSFGTVAIIIYGISGRLYPQSLWWKWFRMQWVIGVGLIPLTLLFFQMFSGVALLANALAIPWVGWVILPLSLLAAMIYPIWPWGGEIFWQAADRLLQPVWQILTWFASIEQLQWHIAIANHWLFITTVGGFLLAIAPRGLPGRWLGVLWLLPLYCWPAAKPTLDEVWFTLLDVGQGLAAVIRTSNHTLIFDTGAKFSNSDMGSAVVIPFLQLAGIKVIDALVISHADNDHRGGAASILKNLTVKQIYSSAPELFLNSQVQLCHQGIEWQWDKVNFKFINIPIASQRQKNNNSCVLQITLGPQKILLPGDIEKVSERYLVQTYKGQLKSTILVVPHHGSRTSSATEFVNQVQPAYALFATGYLNRYHFPHPVIRARYQAIGAKILNTANTGAITLKFRRNQPVLEPELARISAGHYWNLAN